MLGPADILEGALPHPGTRFYVIGCYDSRITFYSQQVRALLLIHALHDQGYLATNPRIAVIGAGAAGVTAAAAAALVTTGEVFLFERAPNIMPLQALTLRRHLDPHIFDWPESDTDDPVADLPILDWEKGPSRQVHDDVEAEFEAVAQRLGARLQRRMRQEVKGVTPQGNMFSLSIERDREQGDPADPPGSRVLYPDAFDMVLLAIGFGREPEQSVPGIPNRSYWEDAGVPGGAIAGAAHPRFLISGNGDGGLIDLVAAGSADFSHAEMIRVINSHPGVAQLFLPLRSLDVQARAAEAAGTRFDYIAAYDVQILPLANQTGLIAAVRQRLKPGVQLVLQTLHAEAFAATSSALNRLAAWLVMRACDTDAQANFRHLACPDLIPIAPPDPAPYLAQHWFDCGGEAIGANEVIVRRGPVREAVRAPFDNMLAGFDAEHRVWLAKHGDAVRVPKLSSAARKLFTDAAIRLGLPMSQREARQLANLLPARVQVRTNNGALRWSGTAAPAEIAAPWADAGSLEIACPDAPADLGPTSAALIRAAAHSRRITLIADPASWNREAQRLTALSLQAEGMPMPRIENRQTGGNTRDPLSLPAAQLASRLNQAMDRWMLDAIHRHIEAYCATGQDFGWRIGIEAHDDLRHAMAAVWQGWHASFIADPALLARFLQLMVCAVDADDSLDSASVLVGPITLDALIRGTAVACMIASDWQATTPHGVRPGNLKRQRAAGDWCGHSCGASRIDGKPLALCAADFMWQTEFVILSLQGSLKVATEAEEAFSTLDPSQPPLTDTAGSGQLIMTIDDALRDAAKAGPAALHALLEAAETGHFAARRHAILPIDRENAA